MEKENEEIRTLMGFHYFIHERIYREANHGRISRKDALVILRRNHNIPKSECPIILKGLEILGLLIPENKRSYIIKKPEPYEELLLEFKKKMKLI